MENVWYDSEVHNGRGTKTEYGDGNEYYYGPENKRECPCDTCPCLLYTSPSPRDS